MVVSVEIVNAFIDGDTGGNPAGVVLDANSLSSEQKLKILGIQALLSAKGVPKGSFRHYFRDKEDFSMLEFYSRSAGGS
jgi:hypothetical protein